LTGAGVTAANDLGLYAGSIGGLVKVIRKGDLVDVDPGVGVDTRTVSDIVFETHAISEGNGRGLAFTNSGFLGYQLTFTDGSSGVFVSQIAPVPEPTGVLATAAFITGALVLVRREGRASVPPGKA
jgi:hypothetical protein